jgi:hypothetical protein
MIIKIDDKGLGDSTAPALQVHSAVIRDAARRVIFNAGAVQIRRGAHAQIVRLSGVTDST